MKTLISTIFSLFLLFVVEELNAKEDRLIRLENYVNYRLEEVQARDVLKDWVGIHDRKKSTYLYNLDTEEFFCKFQTGIRSAQIKDLIYTSGVINVRIDVNDDAQVFVSFNRKTGKVIHCKAMPR